MRNRLIGVQRAVVVLAVFMAMGVVGVGCSSGPKGPGRTAKAVESLKDTQKHLADANKQIAATNDSLRKLADGSGDLNSEFKKYVENVNRTENMAKEAKERSDAMKKNTDVYVAEWQKELANISDASLRQKSQERAANAKADFDRVRSAASEARAAYDPYMQALKDVQQYLANDLTPGGVSTIRSKVDDTLAKGETLQQRVSAVQTETNALAAKWSPKPTK